MKKRRWHRATNVAVAVVLVLGVVLGVQMTRDTSPASASGVTTSGVELTDSDPDNNYTYIQFDIEWNYSWHDNVNWDAVWVFAKYKKTGGDGSWHHCHLDTSGHSVTATNSVPATIDAVSDSMGVFIYRTEEGNGTNDWDGVKLKWPYGSETGETLVDDDKVTIRVFVIEMVNIPTDSFDIGDGNGSTESTYAFHTGSGNDEVNISTILASDIHVDTNGDDDSVIETGTGIGIDGDGGLDTDDNGSIDNADFPTGYNAFYVMKYEISQGQYAEFLNTLTTTQATTRFSGATTNRHYVEVQDGVYGCDADGDNNLNESNDGYWTACNYLSWMDGTAYGDWAGLRPMTELEFEKISRGPTAAVSAEYAWGDTTIHASAYTITDDGQANATANNSATLGNASYSITDGSVDGPLRCGIFADTDSDRREAGATFYGVMEMSGNLRERSVTVGNPTGRGFAGSHGDGSLSTDGNATNSDWPGYVTGEVTGATGSGFRGGGWSNSESNLCVSRRYYAAYTSTARGSNYGFRLVRTS